MCGEFARNGRDQLRLVVLHGKHVMASASDDGFAHVLMAEGRIGCDNSTGQHEVFQHLQRDLVFVGVAGNDTLMNDRLGPLIDDVQ